MADSGKAGGDSDEGKVEDDVDAEDGMTAAKPPTSKNGTKAKPKNGPSGVRPAQPGSKSTVKMLSAVLLGAILGMGGLWGVMALTGIGPTKTTGSQTITVPNGTPNPPPTGWDTTFSVRLDVKNLGEYDSSGPAAWDASKHPLVYVTTNGAGYGGFPSSVTTMGIAIIDGETREVIIEMQYKFDGVEDKSHAEAHGAAVAPDGKWIYLVAADMTKPSAERGRLLVIDAKTLRVHQVLQTSGNPHHVKVVEWYDGTTTKDLVLVEIFNWQTATGRPGSGVFVLDPNDQHRVVGGIRSEDVQANPYLAFPHPTGRYLFVGLPPGPISDPDIKHNIEGMWAVIDMKTWLPVKYYVGGYDPIWTAFTADGKYAYLGDGGSDEIFKIDNSQQKVVGTSRSSIHGGYGIHLNWNESRLFVVEKGEASHNRGTLMGEVDPIGMKPVQGYETHCLRGDHAILHPDGAKNELWISYNSNFRDVVFDTEKREVKTSILHSGSSHNGAFVRYTVDGNGQWTGELLSDQSGLHGSARAAHEDALGVKEIAYMSFKVSVDVFRK